MLCLQIVPGRTDARTADLAALVTPEFAQICITVCRVA